MTLDNPPVTPASSSDAPAWLKWTEVLLVTVASVGAGFWLRPDDPLHLGNTFAWPAIAPLLVGLRYGFFAALCSALLVLLVAGWQTQLEISQSYPWGWAAGILACGLIAGEFRDYWNRQLERSRAVNEYSLQRLEEFTRSFYLMKVSHDRLEQQLAGSSGSLREALRRLYAELSQTAVDDFDGEHATLMLGVLTRYGQFQSAAIMAVEHGQVAEQPLAALGDFESVSGGDPLIRYALERRTLVSVQTEYRKHLSKLDTELLAVIPLINSAGTLSAVCAVKAMPFFNFQNRTLRLLAILAGHMADMISQRQADVVGSSEWQALCFQSRRAALDAEHFDLPATLLRLEVAEPDLALLEERMTAMLRGLDVIAVTRNGSSPAVVLLMPLTDELGLAGYLQRLELDIRESTGRVLWEFASKHTLLIRHQQEALNWLLQVRTDE